jgi:hypothetical protein
VSDIAMNVEVVADGLLGANISTASQELTTGTRWTAFAEFTKNGVEDTDTFSGNYVRNNQSTTDTFGYSANLLSFIGVATNDDVGVSVSELAGTEGGGNAQNMQVGWFGFWGVNLSTLEPPIDLRRIIIIN